MLDRTRSSMREEARVAEAEQTALRRSPCALSFARTIAVVELTLTPTGPGCSAQQWRESLDPAVDGEAPVALAATAPE
jgi:hypothetical protein